MNRLEPGVETVTLDVRTLISVEPRRIGATPSEPLTFLVTVTNDTRRFLRYAATVTGLEGAAVSSSPDELDLGPGESGAVEVAVRLPAVFPAGNHVAGVEVRSSDPGTPLVGFVEIEVDVQSVAGARMLMPDAHMRGRLFGRGHLVLYNGGLQPLSFHLEGHSPDHRLRFRFEPQVVTIDPGTSVKIKARVGAAPRPVGSPVARAFDIIAQGPSGQLSVSGTFVHKAMVPTGFFKLVLAVAAMIAVAFLLQFLVRRFIIDSPEISWQRLSTGNTEVVARSEHTAVWVEFSPPPVDRPIWQRAGNAISNWFTGRGQAEEGMVVWGGTGPESQFLGTGALYRARDGQWLLLPDTGAPAARTEHAATWTGETMVVWGGRLANGDDQDPGAEYNPSLQTWASLPPGPLRTRTGHTMTWTGTEMVVFGGVTSNGVVRADGAVLRPGRLDPAQHPDAAPGEREQELAGGGWAPLAEFPGAARHHHSATWTGNHLIIMGGYDADGAALADAYAYDPASGTWADISRNPPPVERACHRGVWTGTSVILIGGTDEPLGETPCSPLAGLPEDPEPFLVTPTQSDEGTRIVTTWEWSRPDEPPPAHLGTEFVALWTANELTVIQDVPQLDTLAAVRYHPSSGTVNLPLPDPGSVVAESDFTGVWNTGAIVVWGGRDENERPTADGALLILPDR